MTDEHVFADWVSQLFGLVKGEAETWDANGMRRSWSGTAFQDALPVVCEKCNTTWMSRMEQDVAPILGPMMVHGRQATLPPRFQEKLAAWAVKTAMVAAYLPPGHKLIPDVQYDDFYALKKPLPGQLVWVAFRASYRDAARPEDLIAEMISQPLTRISAQGGDPVLLQTHLRRWVLEGRRMYRVTFTIGHFVCQIFGHNFPMSVNVDIGRTNRNVLQIWPANRSLSWPPPSPIEDIGGLGNLHRAFDGAPQRDVSERTLDVGTVAEGFPSQD